MRGNDKNQIGIMPRLTKELLEVCGLHNLGLYLSVVKISRKGITDLLDDPKEIKVNFWHDFD